MQTELKVKETSKGWKIIDGDSHISKWCEDMDVLQHDLFLPPLVCKELREGDCVIDLGANIGSHSVAYSRAVGAKGMCIAVEAGALAFECLKHNITQFPYPNTFSLHAAVDEQCGNSVQHQLDQNVGASKCLAVAEDKRVVGNKYLLTVNVDYIAHQCERPIAFIKMDVEGWEVKALLGASQTLTKDRPKMLIEVNPAALMLQGDTKDDIFAILKHHGYTWTIVQPECTVDSDQYDILAVPDAVNQATEAPKIAPE